MLLSVFRAAVSLNTSTFPWVLEAFIVDSEKLTRCLQTDNIDVIAASMANSLGAGGGFCVGSKEVVDHQRLSSAAYVFSASLPSILAVAAMTSLSLLDEAPSKFIAPLRENTQIVRSILGTIPGIVCFGAEVSPLMHLRLKERLAKRDDEEMLLQEIVDEVSILMVFSFVIPTHNRYLHSRPPRTVFWLLGPSMCLTR